MSDANPLVSTRLRVGPGNIGPDDPRYSDLVGRGFNKRFQTRPDYVRLVGNVNDTVTALQEAVDANLRLTVRSGGHCLDGLVDDPAVRVLIDTSQMRDVCYDIDMGAFAVEAGATMGEVYRNLYLGWGVMLPAGEAPTIGAGGHVLGGAFGFFCREHGLAADHLHAVEVVTVDAANKARAVVATRDPSDPNHDLWWAHTGGGGGNFGIVTRYWLRSPAARGNDPTRLLPEAPATVRTLRVSWNWSDFDEKAFTRLVRNFGVWCERNGSADSPSAKLFSTLFLLRHERGVLEMRALCTAGADSIHLLDQHLAAVNDGLPAPKNRLDEDTSWLTFALNPFPELFQAGAGGGRLKGKDAFFRKRPTDSQIGTLYRALTETDSTVPGGMIGLATYGGAVNTIPWDATASPQRDSIITSSCVAGWGDPRDEAAALAWVRQTYQELFAETGGVPAPGGICDGAMINHPDMDLADPAWNTSGVPWHTFYYKNNYPRLQSVKARWDPRDVFQHALSIRLP